MKEHPCPARVPQMLNICKGYRSLHFTLLLAKGVVMVVMVVMDKVFLLPG